MPDAIFADPRLVEVYDALDGERHDLDLYLQIARELPASSVLDVGCGTGVFARALANQGITVVATDPATASVSFAERQPVSASAAPIHWLATDALGLQSHLPNVQVDMATMTANVAQVFLTDDDWQASLRAIYQALVPLGLFVFEARNPADCAWVNWQSDDGRVSANVVGVGHVEQWREVTEVDLPLVSFRHYTRLPSIDGNGEDVVMSESTLRFWTPEEVEFSLHATGFRLIETREAPDRLGRECVYLATKASA